MPKVVVALLNAEQEFQQLQAKDALEAARRLKLDVDVSFAEGHAVVQIQQLFKHIHAPAAERPVVIVVEPATAEGLERVARNAVKAGIGWVLVNAGVAYLDELRAAHPGPLDRGRRHRPARGGADPGPPDPCPRPRRRARAVRAGAGRRGSHGAALRRPEGGSGRWFRAAQRERRLDRGGGREGRHVVAAAQDRGGLQAGRGRLPERLDGDRRAQGPARPPRRVERRCPSWAATACRRAARSRSRRAASPGRS